MLLWKKVQGHSKDGRLGKVAPQAEEEINRSLKSRQPWAAEMAPRVKHCYTSVRAELGFPRILTKPDVVTHVSDHSLSTIRWDVEKGEKHTHTPTHTQAHKHTYTHAHRHTHTLFF